jgi:hypothetical protein
MSYNPNLQRFFTNSFHLNTKLLPTKLQGDEESQYPYFMLDDHSFVFKFDIVEVQNK